MCTMRIIMILCLLSEHFVSQTRPIMYLDILNDTYRNFSIPPRLNDTILFNTNEKFILNSIDSKGSMSFKFIKSDSSTLIGQYSESLGNFQTTSILVSTETGKEEKINMNLLLPLRDSLWTLYDKNGKILYQLNYSKDKKLNHNELVYVIKIDGFKEFNYSIKGNSDTILIDKVKKIFIIIQPSFGGKRLDIKCYKNNVLQTQGTMIDIGYRINKILSEKDRFSSNQLTSEKSYILPIKFGEWRYFNSKDYKYKFFYFGNERDNLSR